MRLCSHHQCNTRANFGVQGTKTAAFCRLHAEDDMVNVCTKRCSHATCTRVPFFNVGGSKAGVYCKQHADDGMIHVRSRHCSHDTCLRIAYFNVKGRKTTTYCKQLATDGMVNVKTRRCSHSTCSVTPSLDVEGIKTAAYRKQHGEDGMVDVRSKRCSHASCTRTPSWGLLAGGAANACADHKSIIVDGPVVNFKALCKVAGCVIFSTWGYSGRQPSYCGDHGPTIEGLAPTTRTNRSKYDPRSAEYASLGEASFHVKAECLF